MNIRYPIYEGVYRILTVNLSLHLPVYRMWQAVCPPMDKQPYGQGNP